MSKVRDILPGHLPSGDLPEGEVVLSPVGTRRFFGKYLTSAQVLLHAHRTVRRTGGHVLFRDDLNWRTKIQRIMADLITESTSEFFKPETLHLAGFRMAKCQCSLGYGHRKLDYGHRKTEFTCTPSPTARERNRANRRRPHKRPRPRR